MYHPMYQKNLIIHNTSHNNFHISVLYHMINCVSIGSVDNCPKLKAAVRVVLGINCLLCEG